MPLLIMYQPVLAAGRFCFDLPRFLFFLLEFRRIWWSKVLDLVQQRNMMPWTAQLGTWLVGKYLMMEWICIGECKKRASVKWLVGKTEQEVVNSLLLSEIWEIKASSRCLGGESAEAGSIGEGSLPKKYLGRSTPGDFLITIQTYSYNRFRKNAALCKAWNCDTLEVKQPLKFIYKSSKLIHDNL